MRRNARDRIGRAANAALARCPGSRSPVDVSASSRFYRPRHRDGARRPRGRARRCRPARGSASRSTTRARGLHGPARDRAEVGVARGHGAALGSWHGLRRALRRCRPRPLPPRTGADRTGALPDGVTVALLQLRSDVAARQAQVEVHNGGERADRDRRCRGHRSSVRRRRHAHHRQDLDGARRAARSNIRIQLPEMSCDAADGASTVELTFLDGDAEVVRTAPLPDRLGFLPPLSRAGVPRAGAGGCRDGEHSRPSSRRRPGCRPDLALEIAPTGEGGARIAAIQSTNLLTFARPGGRSFPIDLSPRAGRHRADDRARSRSCRSAATRTPCRRTSAERSSTSRSSSTASPASCRSRRTRTCAAGSSPGSRTGASSARADGSPVRRRDSRLVAMVQSSVAPQDPAAARGISRRTQSEIYRAGISGTKPRVPVDAERSRRPRARR